MTATFTKIAETPLLQDVTSTGKPKFWRGTVVTDGTDYYLQSESWQGAGPGESKHLFSTPARVEPKNVGRANATTAEQQAKLELQSNLEKKLKKGYKEVAAGDVTNLLLNMRDTIEAVQARDDMRVQHQGFVLPMLAHPLAKKAHRVVYPCFIQPKLDGVRCLYNSAIGFWSRQLNAFDPKVTAHLTTDTGGLTLDGELLLPRHTFQETISAIKKYRKDLSPQLIYVVYDLVDPALPFIERWRVLRNRWPEAEALWHPQVVPCPTHVVEDMDGIARHHMDFTLAGFEGSIIRAPLGKYTPGHRSDSLLKHKDLQTDEFTIIGYEDGTGGDEGAIIYKCQTPAGREFTVRPRGAIEDRRKAYQAAQRSGWHLQSPDFIGKQLTVQFQNLSDDGVPRFPVGIGIRDYE